MAMPTKELSSNTHGQLSPSQLTALHSLFHLYAPRFLDASGGDARAARLAWASGIIGREVSSFSLLHAVEAARLIELMKKALGQEVNSGRGRRQRPGRDLARTYGTAGRRNQTSNEIALVDISTLALLDRLLVQLDWSHERFDAFLHSKSSPSKSGAIRTLSEANRVIWALKNMLRRQESSIADAAGLKRAG
jgi:hypothetical protein